MIHWLDLIPGLGTALRDGISVLGIGDGCARHLIPVARQYPQSRFTGWQPSEADLLMASEELRHVTLDNIYFLLSHRMTRDTRERFDCVSLFGILEVPERALRAARDLLTPGGLVFVQGLERAILETCGFEDVHVLNDERRVLVGREPR